MLRKFTALLMLTSFTHAFAMTPVQETSALSKALEQTFNEMNYSLNVEWDQKDQVYFNQTVDGFENQIKNLQDQGLTNKELIDYTLAKVKDKQIQNDISEISKVINESELTPDQARDFALEKLSSTHAQGASWSGSKKGIKLAIILCLIIIIVCASKSDHGGKDHDDHHDGKHDRPNRGECRDYYNESSYEGGGYDQCNQYPTAA